MADNYSKLPMSPIPPVNQTAVDLQTISNLAQTPMGATTLNMARDRGNDLATQNTVLQDRAVLNPFEFSQKYGQDAARNLDQISAAQTANVGYTAGSRTPLELLNDTVVNIGSGVASGFGGIGALAVSPFSPETAVNIAEGVKAFNESGQATQSRQTQNARVLDGIRRQLDSQDEQRQYKEDLKTDGSVKAGLKSMGRGAINALARMAEDPASIEAGVTEGIGSLLTGAPVARALGILGKAAMPAAIGVQEAGGTYMGTANEIMDMSHEDLFRQSEEFRELVRNGTSPEEAKISLANRAGQVAAAVQFPLATATGTLVSRFEANPFKAVTARGALQNIGKETMEELVQSGTGQFAQNVGTTVADNDRSLIEGVGSSAVEGAVYGMGTAAALSGPAVGRNMAGQAIKAAVGGIQARSNAVTKAIESNAPASDTRTVRDLLDTQEDVQTLADNIEASIPNASPEDQALAQEATVNLRQGMLLSMDDLTALSPASQQAIGARLKEGGEPNKAEAMIVLGSVAGNEQASVEDRVAAARDLVTMIQKNDAMLETLNDYVGKYSDNIEGFEKLSQYNTLLSRVLDAPSVNAAIRWMADPSTMPADVQPAEIIGRASLAPTGVPVEQAKNVLYQIDNGEVSATRAERVALAASIAMNEAAATVAPEQELTPAQIVSRQIQAVRGDKEHQLSINEHRDRIVKAFRDNDIQAAQDYMEHAVNFAQTLANKVAAANQSIAEGFNKPIAYRTSGAEGKWLPKRQWGTWTARRNGNGIKMMQDIAADATAFATFVNNLSEMLPEIARPRIEVPSLVLPTAKPTEQVTEQVKEAPAKKAEQLKLDLPEPKKEEPQETTPEVETPSDEQILTDERMIQEDKRQRRIIADERELMEDKKARRQEQETVEEPEAVEEAPVAPVEYDRTDNLLRNPGEDTPHFSQVLKVDNNSGNRMLNDENPLATLKDAIKSSENLDAYLSDKDAPKPTVENRRALHRVLNLVPGIRSTMENALNKRLLTQKLWKRFLDGDVNLLKTKQFQLANIASWNGEKLVLNPALADLAIMAGLDTVVNYSRGKLDAKPAEITKALGLEDDADISGVIDIWNSTSSITDIKRAIAARIEQFWGTKGNNNVPDGIVKAISEGVAADLMEVFSDEGLFKEIPIEIGTKDNIRLSFNERDQTINDVFDALGSAKTLLGLMVTGQREQTDYTIGSPVTELPKTLHNKPTERLTADNAIALRNANATEYSTDVEFFDFYASADEATRLLFQGGRQVADGVLNENHAKTIEGKNRTILSGFQRTKDYVDNTRNNAEANGVPVSEVKAFWPHTMISTNRMMQLGGITPQSDKLLRHVSVPTTDTIDMTNPEMEATFWLAVSQGMGESPEKKAHSLLNFTTDRQGTDPLIEDMRTAFLEEDGKFYPLVQQVKEYLDTGKGDATKFLNDMIEISGKDRSLHGVSSIFGVARYLLAMERGDDLTKFQTNVYLEADGKTNGPAMSMAMLGAQSIYSPTGLKALAKTGIFIGSSDKTLNEHIANVDSVDLYKDSANKGTQYFNQLRQKLVSDGNQKAVAQMDALTRVLSAMSVNINFSPESGELTIERGGTKNPLTITVYGSGDRGIAGNIASELVTTMYEYLSELNEVGGKVLDLDALVAERNEGLFEETSFLQDLTKLTQTAYSFDRSTGKYKAAPVEPQKLTNNAQKFHMPKPYFDALVNNVLTFYIRPLMEGVGDAMKQYVDNNVANIQEATNVQSIFAQAVYRARVAKAVLNHVENTPDYSVNDFLSQNEQREIQKGMEHITASVRTGKQNFNFMSSQINNLEPVKQVVNGKARKIGMPTEYARSSGNRFSTPAYSFGYDLVGVAGIPGIVIGTGDGMIIQNTWVNNPEAVAHTLPVYDGVNIRVSDVVPASRALNESVWTAMLSNPLKDVSAAFDIFMKNSPLDLLAEINEFPEVAAQFNANMARAINGTSKPKEAVTEDEIRAYLERVKNDLSDNALRIEARNNVIGSDVSVSVDQMASAGAAFTKKGKLDRADFASDEAFTAELQKRIDAEYERLKAKRDGDDGIDRNTDDLTEALDEYAVVTESGAKVLDASALRNYVLDKGRTMPAGERAVFAQAVDVMQNLGWAVVYGENQKDYEAQNFPEYYSNNEEGNYLGKTVVGPNRVFLNNVSQETLLHEMIHAATFDQVNQYYTDKASMPEYAAKAVERIEGLMQEWLAYDETHMNQNLLNARRSAVNTVVVALQVGNRALAVNEFMAWSLANRTLADDLATRKISNPLLRIAKEIFSAIEAMFWGDKKGPRVGDDVLSNLQFNTQVLIKSEDRYIPVDPLVGYQSVSFGSNDRLTALDNKVSALIEHVITQPESLNKGVTTIPQRMLEQQMATARGVDASQLMHRTAFAMTAQQGDLFAKLVSIFGTSHDLDSNALSGMARLHREFIKDLTVEDFIPAGQEGNPNVQLEARNKFDLLTGVYDFGMDDKGRSLLLPTFAALASVDDGFRALLAQKIAKQSDLNKEGGLDAFLENLGTKAMDGLSRHLSGQGNAKNVTAAIDNLVKQLLDINDDKRSFIEQRTNAGLDRMDELLASGINTAGTKVADAGRKLKQSSNPAVRAAGKFTTLIGTILNQKEAAQAREGITAALNARDGGHTIREFVAEIVGRTDQNAEVFDMISPVRAAVHQSRQNFREGLPNILNQAFKKAPTREQWQDMFHVLGKTDLAGTIAQMGIQTVRNLVGNPVALEAEINKVITKITDKEMVKKADQLAAFMAGQGDGNHLLRNAYAIAHLAGQPGAKAIGSASAELIAAIDQYVSLKALHNMPAEMQQRVADLIKEDADGVDYTLHYLTGLRKDELARVNDPITRLNHYKGYIPSLAQTGSSLRLVSVKDHTDMIKRGYTYLGDYVGNGAERHAPRLGYYFAPVSGQATYNQGAMLTTHQTASGVQPGTGYTAGQTAGRIIDPVKVRQITALMARTKAGTENLRPVFDATGKIVAYERSLDEGKLAMLKHNTHLGMMMGAWAGRIVEEQLAGEFNTQLIEKLYADWSTAKDRDAFVDISDTNDKVWADTWNMFPQGLKKQIKDKFGSDGFPIRRDQVIDAVGTRSASIGDAWNGVTRWDDATQKRIQEVATGILGKGAYRKLVAAERMVQDFVTDAKVLIVVKSIFIPVANMVANIHQLLTRGVPLRDVVRGSARKMAEINEYVLLRNKEIKLDADLRAAKGRNDTRQIGKLTTELQTIQDTYKRMSIAPLIEAGEFSAVTEGGISQEDLALAEGRWGNFVEKLGNNLPNPLRLGYRYGTLSRDTALFKGLGRAVQYGDFIAKAVFYDDLVKRKGMSKEQALALVSEEYVNYNRFAGRSRQYAESMGLIWFWNFKIRSMKVAASMIRNNPARALIATAATPTLPFIGSVGSPVTDNLANVAIDGRLGYSVGPWMGFRAPSLNPWWQLMN